MGGIYENGRVASLERTPTCFKWCFQRIKQEGSKLTDEELQRYQDRISELEKDIICKEEELESKTHLIDDLRQQLETGQASVRSFKQGENIQLCCWRPIDINTNSNSVSC